MPKIAHTESRDEAAEKQTERFTKVARQTTDVVVNAARENVERAQSASANAARESIERARKIAEDATANQREIALRSTEDLSEANRMVLELFAEQTRHGLEAASVFTRAVDWAEIFAAQRDFLNASLDRTRQLNDRYREMVQAGLKAFALPVRR